MHSVLICEDDPILAADLSAILEEAGHTVSGVFQRVGEALISARKEKPDFAIIDLKLADGDTGAGAAKTLHSMGVRIIVLSGYSNVGTGLGYVPHTFAQKPVSKEVILDLLDCRHSQKFPERGALE
jgi:ActR/RegA family two-component response regulator